MATRRHFGTIRELRSGRFQARYTGPDGVVYPAQSEQGKPITFESKEAANAWLSCRQADILRNQWLPPTPKAKPQSFRTYADAWLAARKLEVRTRELYARLLTNHIHPAFGKIMITEISPVAVRGWYAALGKSTGPTAREHAYALLRTIMRTAVKDELIKANPCRVDGAGQPSRVKVIQPASVAELEAIAAAMPAKYKLAVLLAAWCALRFGEMAALRRSDIDLNRKIVHIKRSVVLTDSGPLVKSPKTAAGRRSVAIPPHLMQLIKAHMNEHAAAGPDGLLFPATRTGGHITVPTLFGVYKRARTKAGRPDLRFHDLRHTGATFAASTGASLAELMARLGHESPRAAMRYQHAVKGRDEEIANALSELAKSNVTAISRTRGTKRKGRKAS